MKIKILFTDVWVLELMCQYWDDSKDELMTMKKLTLRGNMERNAATCWSKHKTNFSGLEEGMCEGGTKTSIDTRECRVRGSGRDFHHGWQVDDACVSVCVSVDEIKESWLFRGLVNIMAKQNDTLNLCLGTKLAMTSVCFVHVLLLLLAMLFVLLSFLSIAAFVLFVCCYACYWKCLLGFVWSLPSWLFE